jgi:hypothetical protein
VGFSRHACALALLFSTATFGGSTGAAQAPAPARSAPVRRAPLETLNRQARAPELATARSAIEGLAAMPAGPAADRALAELIHEGASDGVTDAVLEALAAHPRAGSIELLAELAQHRRAAARVRAVEAIAKLGARPTASVRAKAPGSRATQALIRALGDSDPGVRGAAARGLGERDEAAGPALDALLRAVERGVPEAGRSAGLLAPEAELTRLHAALSARPMQVVLDAYDALLARSSISEAAKLDVIARLGEVASDEAKAFLERLIADKRFAKDSRLERAAIDTAKRIAPPPTKRTP